MTDICSEVEPIQVFMIDGKLDVSALGRRSNRRLGELISHTGRFVAARQKERRRLGWQLRDVWRRCRHLPQRQSPFQSAAIMAFSYFTELHQIVTESGKVLTGEANRRAWVAYLVTQIEGSTEAELLQLLLLPTNAAAEEAELDIVTQDDSYLNGLLATSERLSV